MMMPADLFSRPLIEIARDLREKRVTARELIDTAIARHERFGERLHAYSHWAPEQARAAAAAADAVFSAGLTVGPLQGLPVSISHSGGQWILRAAAEPRPMHRAWHALRCQAGVSFCEVSAYRCGQINLVTSFSGQPRMSS
jgi:Amidase